MVSHFPGTSIYLLRPVEENAHGFHHVFMAWGMLCYSLINSEGSTILDCNVLGGIVILFSLFKGDRKLAWTLSFNTFCIGENFSIDELNGAIYWSWSTSCDPFSWKSKLGVAIKFVFLLIIPYISFVYPWWCSTSFEYLFTSYYKSLVALNAMVAIWSTALGWREELVCGSLYWSYAPLHRKLNPPRVLHLHHRCANICPFVSTYLHINRHAFILNLEWLLIGKLETHDRSVYFIRILFAKSYTC